MSKRKQPESKPSSTILQAPEQKKAKIEAGVKDTNLLTALEKLNSNLDRINRTALESSQEGTADAVVSEKLLQLMQKAKDIGKALNEPTKRNRALLTSQDLAVNIEGETGLHRRILQNNRSLLQALPEFGDATGEDVHLGLVVDAFAEELDAIRQNEEIGPSKLELLIDSLKTGAAFYSQYETELLQRSINK